jgi:hypothetical protein
MANRKQQVDAAVAESIADAAAKAKADAAAAAPAPAEAAPAKPKKTKVVKPVLHPAARAADLAPKHKRAAADQEAAKAGVLSSAQLGDAVREAGSGVKAPTRGRYTAEDVQDLQQGFEQRKESDAKKQETVNAALDAARNTYETAPVTDEERKAALRIAAKGSRRRGR